MVRRSTTTIVIASERTTAIRTCALIVGILVHIARIVRIVVIVLIRAVGMLSSSMSLWSLLIEWLLLLLLL